MKRKTEITIETERLLIISKRNTSSLGWCADCGGQVRLLNAEVASQVAGVSPRAIYRLIEAGHLHFIETSDQRLLICINSLGQMTEALHAAMSNDAMNNEAVGRAVDYPVSDRSGDFATEDKDGG